MGYKIRYRKSETDGFFTTELQEPVTPDFFTRNQRACPLLFEKIEKKGSDPLNTTRLIPSCVLAPNAKQRAAIVPRADSTSDHAAQHAPGALQGLLAKIITRMMRVLILFCEPAS